MSPPGSFLVPTGTCLPQSNLEHFLQCITPLAPSKLLPQSYLHELNNLWQPPGNKEIVKYFTLEDLWDCYTEWSVYGIGIEVKTDNGESIMQYYVPYLSAIQLYSNKSVAASRNPKEYSDIGEFESDSWSDDSMSDKLSRTLSNDSSKTWDSISDDSSFDHDCSSLSKDRLGYLYLQYIEMSSPYWRVSLVQKINELAKTYPGIVTLKNVDLSPASWIAVAWYPIYHIPSRCNEKDLSTCFITYHTLSSSFQDCEKEYDNTSGFFEARRGSDKKGESKNHISLPPFGLATYKLYGDIWLNQEMLDNERLVYLYSAADSWLKQLNVHHHHDFNFFTYHSTL